MTAAAFFSFLNSNERATLDLGFTVLYRISLVGLVFGSFLLGMITMFLFGLRYDRKVREALRDPTRRPIADDPFYFDKTPDTYFDTPPDTPP